MASALFQTITPLGTARETELNMSSIVCKTPASSSWSTGNPSLVGTLTLGAQLSPGRVDFSDLFGDAKIICVTLDTRARVTYCNDYLLHLTGWERSDVIGQDWFELFIPPNVDDLRKLFASILIEEPLARHHENEILTRSGECRLIRWKNSLLRSTAGDVIGTASIGEDITDRRESENKIGRLNRVYAVLSGINTLIVRVRNRDELFKEACRIAVEQGGFRMSLI